MGLFDSGREDDDDGEDDEEDDDEDYNMHEDILKNFKHYKHDEEWRLKNRITVRKSEVDLLIADQRKSIDDAAARVPQQQQYLRKR